VAIPISPILAADLSQMQPMHLLYISPTESPHLSAAECPDNQQAVDYQTAKTIQMHDMHRYQD